ncbi:sacsin-like [Acropora muricata]|uniref:sacsin-like n=1 Tax=Acropora muricata TaxID=159855 RepID=UPI0034E46DE4
MASNDEGFDLIQPSLIQQLRKILDEYPDDGQILKELIQNAEDAGATKVKFLHDKNSYGTAQLYDDCEELSECQGPALYAHNNALFTVQDWKGIRLVCDSIKVEDPMKVGRFGLGFKSVFHMTDLPSLLSECQIGFIDPHGVCFSDKRNRRTGKLWHLQKDFADMETIPDQFSPFKGIFDCTDNVFSEGFYNGTLFRLPLRRTPSKLSETLYTEEKVDNLFESFKTDAHLIVLFLQNLESIELHVRQENQPKSRKVFQVKISDECLHTVQAKRKEFLEEIRSGIDMSSSVAVTFPITIETVNFDLPDAFNTKKHSFLVTNYFCGGQVSSTFRKLVTDKSLCYLPMVGVAMALPTAPAVEPPAIKGHVFCFLPLPVQKTSLTGLPVHVNGFFALSQNRRHIKFPDAEQEDRETAGRHLTDKSLLWNKCLLREAIPRAYAEMILNAISEDAAIPEVIIYNAWPDVGRIAQKWRGIEAPLFQLLLENKVVYTKANGGSWVKVEDAFFQCQPEDELNELLMKVLLSVGISAVAIPDHVSRAVDKYSPRKKEIQPDLIRYVLQQRPSSYVNLGRKEKLLLLKFSLSDGQFSDLEGLQLLPLSNGDFLKFERRARTVFISSKEHPQELFPGLDERFLDRGVDEKILDSLFEAVDQGRTQLKHLKKMNVPDLLRNCLPEDWKRDLSVCNSVSWFPDENNCNHPPKDWLKLVWDYLSRNFTTAEHTQCLTNLPLIPLNLDQTPVLLAPLRHPSSIVVKRSKYDFLDDALGNVLKKIGLVVVTDCPCFVTQHPLVLGTFVNPPSTPGVLMAMTFCLANSQTFLRNVHRLSIQEKRVLRSFLASTQKRHLRRNEWNLLCVLPLFETHFGQFVSQKEGMFAVPTNSLPIQLKVDLIDSSSEDSRSLARLLEIRKLNTTELLCEIVFPGIQKGQYSEQQIDELMPYVLRNFSDLIRFDENFKRKIKELPFVPKGKERVKPSSVFDPRNETLQQLFAHEDVFPVGEQYKDPAVLVALGELGMRNEDKITAKHILKSARQLSMLPFLNSVEKKAEAVLQYLSAHPNQLFESVDSRTLASLLKDTCWVPPLRQKSWGFPHSLPWWNENEKDTRHFLRPSELSSSQYVNLVGSVKPIVDVEKSKHICTIFGWGNQPNALDVLRHLRNAVNFYTEDEKPHYMAMVNEIYHFLDNSDFGILDALFDEAGVSKWAWNGYGFSSPCKMLSDETTIDLTPYIVRLPLEMVKFRLLFSSFGMKTECNPDLLLQVLSMVKNKYDNIRFNLQPLEVGRDVKLCVDILNDLASKNEGEELSPELQKKVFFPVHTGVDGYARLEPVQNCMYYETDDWLTNDVSDVDGDCYLVHPTVPTRTAELLGVPSLTNRMLGADELFIGEEFGQEERLTTRINRLLDDYTDGFAVPKELIQNADDAGATEVKFLYDERDNKDALTCLIDNGMRGCQGPALWVYNDAKFKDDDFVNITKLNEATKAEDTQKIGRFGLGFNAVYNLTDVPMFVSRNYFAIFDPHTKYLGKAIRNAKRPGMKINLNKDVKRLRRFKNQFKPFNGVFGCNLSLENDNPFFDGTLFRLPLRTREQANTSHIKRLYYDNQQMRELLLMFLHGAGNLLLFTQSVLRVGIYHVPKLTGQDLKPSLMFEVIKSEAQAGGILRELKFQDFTAPQTALKLSPHEINLLKQCSFLQASSLVKKLAVRGQIEAKIFPKSSILLEVDCNVTKCGNDFFRVTLKQQRTFWLVVSSMGSGKAMQVAKNDRTLLPSAGVACRLDSRESNRFLPLPIEKEADGRVVNGTIFCYLPLPVYSGLPVHINGAFAVASNRRSLQETVADDKTHFGVNWNDVLMQDSVVCAFLDLLEDLKSIAPKDGTYTFHLMWPRASQIQQNSRSFLKSFYSKVAGGGYSLFSDGEKWVDMNNVVFLDPAFREEPKIGDVANEVLKMHCQDQLVVIDMPWEILHSFDCDQQKKINSKRYNKTRFFKEIFFPNIATTPANPRNLLTLHALNCNTRDFREMVMQHACIPVSPNGAILKLPIDLVRTGSEAASLFRPEDGKFPFGTEESYLHPRILAILEDLGMASNDLSWKEVVGRAESIHVLNDVDIDAARERVKALINFMERKLKREDSSPGPEVCIRIAETRFLPILQKPANFPLAWKGDHLERNSLLPPKEICPEESKYLVCCTEPVLGIAIPQNVSKLLNMHLKSVTVQHVIKQLENAMSVRPEALPQPQFDELECVCKKVYITLQQCLPYHGADVIRPIQGKSFILLGRKFVSAKQVALTLHADCSPYLFKLPTQLADPFASLMRAAGVKEKFDADDFKSSLIELHERFQGNELDEDALRAAVQLANQLGEALKTSSSESVPFPLPDSKSVMRPLDDLCVPDCFWIPDEEGVHFINSKISWETCQQLGVKTRQSEALRRHKIGIPFGQKEKLTNRIKRILTGYPCEKEILKEMLQNADDAKATEICFIKDPRHHPDKRLFDDSWKPLQGPALCVYNNRPFTNDDIEGIQNLGEGSKGKDPSKTGQYGVGFNAVYHLTDVPSFLTCGEEVGEALFAFDPHCRYVPEASFEEPGAMFKDLSGLKKTFPDVFSCYLEEQFPLNGGTMFRFPLRTEEMSKTSKLSSTPVTLTAVETMMKDLKKELFEVLLFVNNVKKITLCEINKQSGKIENQYSVEAIMSQEDETKRQDFANHVKQVAQLMKREDFTLSDIKVRKVSYVLNITDNIASKERWLIVQQIGFEKEVPGCINNAFKRGDLGLLPRGGVACLVEKTSSAACEKCKAFCFLPLPFETNLPVHINGHFALDHEARRNLWRDEAGGYRGDWNKALLGDVVASCYLTLLVEVQSFLQLPSAPQIGPCIVQCSEAEILRRVTAYEKLFPLKHVKNPYWRTLVDSLYEKLDACRLKILPVVRKRKKDAETKPSVELTWLPCTGQGSNQAFFNNLSETGPFKRLPTSDKNDNQTKARNLFEEILLETGFNLVASSLSLYDSLQRSNIAACTISPSSVIDFYKSINSQSSMCKIGNIPCHVNETPFRNSLGIILVLLYCKQLDGFLDQLSGLPLLLTENNHLHLFSSTQPTFLSQFHDLLPGSPQVFLHEEVFRQIFTDLNVLKSPFLRPLDIEGFVANLSQTLPHEYYGNEGPVQWCPSQERVPNHNWLSRVWLFLSSQTQHILSDNQITDGSKIERIKTAFQPLANWSIIPAFESQFAQRVSYVRSSFSHSAPLRATELLFPLCRALSILDCSSPDATNVRLVTVLKNFGVPELNYVPLVSSSSGTYLQSSSTQVALARLMVSSLKTPTSLLTCLDQKIRKDPHSSQRLAPTDCKEILDYFSRSVKCLQHSDRRMLRKLPLYRTTHGGYIGLEEHRDVKVLPYGVPREEFELLERVVDTIFLESCPSLSDLFDFIGLESLSLVAVYCTYILPNLNVFSNKAREVHLGYVLKVLLSTDSLSDDEELSLLYSLGNTPFIPFEDGCLKCASFFFDPTEEVFRVMLAAKKFPPPPFQSLEWLKLLRKIGLVHKVSEDHFKIFAEEVANEAKEAHTEKTYEKSRVLVKHLIRREDVVKEGLLPAVCSIPFVACEPVRQELQDLCQPHEATINGPNSYCAFKGAVPSEYAEIVWTKAHLLPRWAIPSQYSHELGCPHGVTKKHYLEQFLKQLQIMINPAVELVVNHCQTLCTHLERQSERKRNSFSKVKEIMGRNYAFLQDQIRQINNGTKAQLTSTPFILVEEGRRFVPPNQVVLELYEDLEIKPYLYRVPPEFGRFHPLFQFLGCCKNVGMSHYVMVLEEVHRKCKTAKLHPNEVSICVKASKGFFEHLDKNEKVENFPKVHLPAVIPRELEDARLEATPLTLQESSTLIFNDVSSTYYDRLQKFKRYFLLDLEVLGVTCSSSKTNYKDLLLRLPFSIRPKMLSCVVREVLIEYQSATTAASGALKSLKETLSCPQFCCGVIRLIRDANVQNEKFDEEVIGRIESGLHGIEIRIASHLKTTLLCDDCPIPDSEAKADHFLKTNQTPEGESCTVYVDAISENTLFASVSFAILELYGEFLGKRAGLINEMLRCHPHEIWPLLDRLKIRADNSYRERGTTIYPRPGSFIPLEDHHLLNEDFEDFDPGDYVGYELDDPTLNRESGVATYIYARIVEEVTDRNCFLLAKRYRIEIGDNQEMEVDATDLYKFHRSEEFNCTAIEVTDGLSEDFSRHYAGSSKCKDKREIFDEISNLLEQAWNMPEDKRRKVIKRLYLRWHPDKNVGNEELCNEIFKHLQNEISRLERGEPRDILQTQQGFSGSTQSTSYDDFFSSWGNRARQHHSQREEYRTRQQSYRTSRGRQNPQPGEARRWFRQARADVTAVMNDVVCNKPSFEWACFKCQQAAEKALKAAQFTIDADSSYGHRLTELCGNLNDPELPLLASKLDILLGNYARTHYPDKVSFPRIPNEVYNKQMALDALQLASRILEIVERRIP